MKTQILNVEGKVRKSTIKFAQALLDVGVKISRVGKSVVGDCMYIKGKRKFSINVLFDYERNCLSVYVLTRKGHTQAVADCKTVNEFRTLCNVWNIAEYAA